jgi:hypothetical protein
MLADKFCVVFANLKPKRLGGVMSNGMVMCAGNNDIGFEIIRPPPGSKIGERLQLEGNPINGAPVSQNPGAAQLNPKKKIEGGFLPLLKTDSEGNCQFNGLNLVTAAGKVKVPSLKNAPIS